MYCRTGMRTRNVRKVVAVRVGTIVGQESYLMRRQALKEWRERSDCGTEIQVVQALWEMLRESWEASGAGMVQEVD